MPFDKGQSGNPGGRPKKSNPAVLRAREFADEAIERLVAIMRGDSVPESRRAAVDLLDRAFGKPKETHTFEDDDGNNPFKEITVTVVRPKPEA